MRKHFDKKRFLRGTSTLEYVILVTGVVSVLILFLRPSGSLSSAVNSSYQSATNGMLDMGDRLAQSRNSPSSVSSRCGDPSAGLSLALGSGPCLGSGSGSGDGILLIGPGSGPDLSGSGFGSP